LTGRGQRAGEQREATLIALAAMLLGARHSSGVPRAQEGEDVEETYALNTFGIVHQEVSSPFAIVFGHAWWRPVRGKYRQALEYRKFYEALGRPDVADAQESLTSRHSWPARPRGSPPFPSTNRA
jgi:hypothetical protein